MSVMGLKSKLFVLLLCVFVVPLFSIGAIGYWIVKQQLFNDAIIAQKSLTEQLTDSARREINSTQIRIELMARDAQLVSRMMPLLATPSATDIEAIRPVLSRLGKDWSGLVEIAVYDAAGRYWQDSQVLMPGHTAPFGFDPVLGQEDLGVAKPVYLLSFNEVVSVQISRVVEPILDERDQLLGYLAVNVQPTRLNMTVDGYEWKAMQFLFTADSGEVLAASQSLTSAADSSLLKAVKSSVGTQPSGGVLSDSGKLYRWVREQVSDSVWLISLLELDSVYGELRRGVIVLMLIAALLLIVAVVVYFRQLSRLVIRPIEALNDATGRISGGDYTPSIAIETDDELGRLANGFREMGQRLQESNDKIAQLAFYDPLTKLPNRETLKRSLTKMVDNAHRSQSLLGVLFVDLDDFKKVNDRLGHSAGDQLLIEVGRRLSLVLRSSDLVVGGVEDQQDALISRRGGDEFNAVVSNIRSARDIAIIAERLISFINEPVELNGGQVSVSASVGIAIFPFDGEEAETLLRNADLAMYEAKNLGKNKYYLYTQSINEQVRQRLEIEQQIADGLKNGEFELFYQPVVYADRLDLASFEALIRWRHPESGVVSPQEFMPLAEESQLIHDIGHWTLGEAMSQLVAWQDQLPGGVRVAVNISARQLVQEHFAENFLSLAEQFGVSPLRLEVELTEASLLTDEGLVREHLLRLSNLGVKITLDDFGTGFSSFTFLRNLPIDCVKIDRDVVATINEGGDAAEAVAALLALCSKLHLDTLAEGVEDAQQLAFLQSHGCTFCQGYLFHEPMPAEDVFQLLESPTRSAG